MLYFFLELEILWLFMMILKINNAINYVLQLKKTTTTTTKQKKKKKKKLHS